MTRLVTYGSSDYHSRKQQKECGEKIGIGEGSKNKGLKIVKGEKDAG